MSTILWCARSTLDLTGASSGVQVHPGLISRARHPADGGRIGGHTERPICYRSRVVTTPPTFKWMLWAFTQDSSGLQDEFIAGEFRVRLMGNSLELTFEGAGVCSPESARSLAESYVQTLSRLIVAPLSLITEADFLARTTPPFGGQMTGSSTWRQDRDRARRAVREARNELLQSADPRLRRCYDHLQDAVEHQMKPSPSGERTAYHDVYMAMEVLIERFGSQKEATRSVREDPPFVGSSTTISSDWLAATQIRS
jgi:hypothetical protein